MAQERQQAAAATLVATDLDLRGYPPLQAVVKPPPSRLFPPSLFFGNLWHTSLHSATHHNFALQLGASHHMSTYLQHVSGRVASHCHLKFQYTFSSGIAFRDFALSTKQQESTQDNTPQDTTT